MPVERERPPSRPPIADHEVRRTIVDEIDRSLVVEAAAGTGKTKVLVDRIVSVVRSGAAQMRALVVVTFTEKAAGELKLRLRQQLEEERLRAAADGAPDGGVQLVTALEQFEEAHVGTIHGFCADLLREYPIEAAVDPDFEVLGDEVAQASFFERVFERWFDTVQHDPPDAVARVLKRMPPREAGRQLRLAARSLAEHRELDRRWTPVPLDLTQAIEPPRAALLDVATLARAQLRERAVSERDVQPLLAAAEAVGAAAVDPRDVEARLWQLRRRLRTIQRAIGRGRRRAELAAGVELLSSALERFCQQSGENLAPLLQAELSTVVLDYEHEKRQAGRLDFTDLLLRTRDLLLGDAVVRAELQQRFSHLFVDEFQDTDPLQAEILLLLCADDPTVTRLEDVRPPPGKLFVVGDPKQSIYRFRRAEVELYERIKRQLGGQRGTELLQLTTSFRAVPQLQAAVNGLFERLMPADPAGRRPSYVPLSRYRPPIDGQPALVALPLEGGGRYSGLRMRDQEPERVGAWLAWLFEQSGWRVSVAGAERTEGSPATEPVQPHHVCLLFRKLKSGERDLVAPYCRALDQRGIPHLVVGGRSFFAREEVDALRTALRAIEWPDDELSVFATLRGPLFGFDDETLLLFREHGGHFSTRRRGDPEQGREVLVALELLDELHPRRNHRPLADTVGRLLRNTRCLPGFSMRNNGELAVRSLLYLQELARQFQRSEGLSFRAFVEYLDRLASSVVGQVDAPIAETARGGVRMMTVHAAKGLEFPVVLLADAAGWSGPGKRGPDGRSAWPPHSVSDRGLGLYAAEICGCRPRELLERQESEADRAREEELRLLYVAMTRARDLLLLPSAAEPSASDGWLAPLAPAITSKVHLASDAPGCPPASGTPMPGEAAAGLHQPQLGDHQLVWWNEAWLPQQRAEPPPLRGFELLDASALGAIESHARFEGWQQRRDALLERAATQRYRRTTATEVAHDPAMVSMLLLSDTRRVQMAETAQPFDPPREVSALAYGAYVHGILEAVDFALQARPEHVARVAGICARIHGMPATAERVASAQVGQALAHPLLRAAAAASLVLREAPLSLYLPGHRLLIEGVADLVYRDDDGTLWVVDYKTDADPDRERIAAYRRQVALYLHGIAEATGQAVEGRLLFV